MKYKQDQLLSKTTKILNEYSKISCKIEFIYHQIYESLLNSLFFKSILKFSLSVPSVVPFYSFY